MYDFTRDLDDTCKKNLRDFVESGKGVVVLHHALLNYQTWPWWYEEVVGGRYRLSPEGKIPRSSVKNDQQIFVTPQGEHPVTAGIAPFHITDETYKQMWISDRVRPLLTTDNPTSDRHPGLDRPVRDVASRRHPTRPRPYRVRPSLVPDLGAQRHPLGGGKTKSSAVERARAVASRIR